MCAQRRMFSLKVIDTDVFLDMPQSSQLLYFHLAMRADDDGFVSSPKKIMKIIGAQEDDIKVLLIKRFLLSFDNGIVVIKHWRIHNLIRNDRYTETQWSKEKEMLIVDERTKKYSLNNGKKENVIPNDNQMAPQVRLGKVRLGKVNSTSELNKKEKKETNIQKIVNYFFILKGWSTDDIKKRKIIYSRFVKPAKDLLELTNNNVNEAKEKLNIIKNWADAQEIDWGIETVFKRWHDLDDLPQEKEKKPFIEGCRAYKKNDEWWVILANGEHKKWVGSLKKVEYK